MPTLYVTEQGAQLEKEYRRLVVSREDEVLLRVPIEQVTEVVLIGRIGVTTPALLALLDSGVGLSLVSSSGRLHGRLGPATARNIPLRHSQYQAAADPQMCLQIGRAIVKGKLHNQLTLAQRMCRSRPSIDKAPLLRIRQAIDKVDTMCGMDELRGLEGSAAHAYFSLFRQALAEGWQFQKRARRPPPDPVNALLGLSYTLLGQNMFTALEIVGLDPYDGFLHADKYGRPALALDLVEEFRAVIADSVVLTVINKRILKPDDFRADREGGVRLKPAALRKFLQQYSARLNTQVFHPLADRSLSYQKCFEIQARLLRKVIEGREAVYRPFQVR